MKKILSTLCVALIAVAAFAQQPVITFEKTEHDFGKINEADGRVSTVFSFKNEGMTPLVLSNVRASCGCTTPTWTKEPIEPGQTGSITVTYNPNGRPGRFQKTVTITSNATEATTRVYIKGEVIPKQAKPVNKYTVKVGELNMATATYDFGTIKKGETKVGEMDYTNLTKEELKVALTPEVINGFVFHQVTLPAVKTNEVGKFAFSIDTKATKLYGPVEVNAYVVCGDKKVIDDAHKLTLKANIVEDFSALTPEQKQQAPIIETQNEFNVGKIAAGKVHKYIFPIKNIGVNPLEVRRVYSAEKSFVIKAPKAIKSGKKGAINVEINAKDLKPGNYSREVIVITNDYANSIKKIKLNFTVE